MPIIAELTEKAKQTRMIMMDVDGVLTDGRILYSSDGVEIEAFHIRDGVGLRAAHRAGLLIALLTGRVSPAVARRAKELGISEIHQGIPDKVETYESLLRRYGLSDEAVAYVGDDLNDLPLLARAGLSAAPADAADEVKARVAYVTARGGGRGAVREVIELILKAQGKWEGVIENRGVLAGGEAFP
ncbi:MAG TPA: HAD family hydrolase [Kiloniellales bacterium]|jgi:3-deoxy-D-manno-octulosonate 8-phosphate phosphatase (KDO 8-P phosphatase)